ncbi:hypothetical protein Clacol_009384 [Clathrus columnatus]|uniref:RING-type domain-containing protein n=1 Tax=Clathrus columnatus TaxID=1419009 RepID=A0AAV5APL6_9AGAM|nr:hypothetical protein Clacol_009384 [Clathrus columnatus]
MILQTHNSDAGLDEGVRSEASLFKFGLHQREIPVRDSNADDIETESADLSPEEADQIIEDLGDMVKALEKRYARANENKELGRNDERVHDLFRCASEPPIVGHIKSNPFYSSRFNRSLSRLECGHFACYSCLRLWWTRASDSAFGDPIISTDDQDNSDDEVTRYRFYLAVNKKKKCPECKKNITQRPVASSIPTIPPLDQRRTTHKDLWRGIFPEH